MHKIVVLKSELDKAIFAKLAIRPPLSLNLLSKAFVWIKDNVSEDYDKAILDPWKATAFTATTERKVYARIHTYPQSSDTKAYEFLRGGSGNTTFLRENGISIIYTRYPVNNPDLVEVRKNVYLLEEAGTK